MSVMVNPAALRKGANTQIGVELGDEPAGLVINWMSGRILVRGHTTEFLGGLNDGLLSYASPSPKGITNGHGKLEYDTTMRCDHDPATLDTSATGLHTLGIGQGAVVQKALTTTGAVTYVAGQVVRLTDAGDITKWILGKVVSFTAGALVVDCFDASGYFTASSWRIIVALGVLVEEQRVNGIRNNSMQGAVVGSALPNNWAFAAGGLTASVVGKGSEDGIDYIDLQIAGTASGSSFNIYSEVTTSIAAANGQTWASSAFIRLLSGSVPAGTTISQGFRISDSVGGNLGFLTPATPLILGKSLGQSRVGSSSTIANASVAYVTPTLFCFYSTGTVFDVTLRIGMPQLEQGSFASSPIRTTGAAATRLADRVSMPLLAIPYNGSNGIVVSDVYLPIAPVSRMLWGVGGSGNEMRVQTQSTGTNPLAVLSIGGVTDTGTGSIPFNPPGRVRSAFAYVQGNHAHRINGGLSGQTLTGSMPTGFAGSDFYFGGRGTNGSLPLNGYLIANVYLPRERTSLTELQQMSAAA